VAGCQAPSHLPEYELQGEAMGTSFSVKLVAPDEALSRSELGEEIRALLDDLENSMSTYREASELSRFNASASTDWQPVSTELCRAIDEALAISRQTGGAFDVTVGPLVNLWGFGPNGVTLAPPEPDALQDAQSRVGYQHLETRCEQSAIRKSLPKVYVDLSAWAKGYAVDRVSALLDRHGLSDYLVEIGGELLARGLNAERRKWAIAIELPDAGRREAKIIVRVSGQAVATSGGYRNYFEYEGKRYSHTIDARTGRPVSHSLESVTVVHESAAFADAMATALLVLGPQSAPALAEELGLACYFQLRDAGGWTVIATSEFERVTAN
jgi:thiamine biosynthesis lipoprotein